MRKLLAVALLLTVAVSGCLAEGHPLRLGPMGPSVGQVTLLDGFGDAAMEPHVAVREARHGPVVVVANMNKIPSDVIGNTLPIGIEVHRSLDGGDTWTSAPLPRSVFAPFDPLGRMPNSGDAVLAYAPDGTLYLGGVATSGTSHPDVPQAESLQDFSVWLSRSTDDGATWSPAVFWQRGVGPVVGLTEDKEWVAVGPDGTIHFAWTEFIGLVGTRIRYTQSTDAGATWAPPRDLALPDLTTLSQVSGTTLAAPGGGHVYASFSDIRGDGSGARQLVIASADNGASFGAPVEVGTMAFPRFGQVFADARDPLHAFVAVPDGNAVPALQVATTTDGGATWSRIDPVAPSAGAQQHAAGWVAGDGRVVLGYYDAGWPEGERFTFGVFTPGSPASATPAGPDVDPGVYRREYLGLAGAGKSAWGAWVAGDEASGTQVAVARLRLGP